MSPELACHVRRTFDDRESGGGLARLPAYDVSDTLLLRVPLDFFGREEAPPDTIKLTRTEQRLKAELEPIVASELPALLQAALALRRIRNARLFRTEAATFTLYLARRYSLSVGMIREVMGAIAASEELIRDLALRSDDPDREGRLRTVGLGRYALAPVIKPVRTGRPGTNENRHDFTEWSQSLDWIVQNIFGLAPLLDGHVEEVLRVSDPALSWLRLIGIAVEKDNRLDEALLASEIVDVCQGHGIDFPGKVMLASLDQLSMLAGKLLNRLFREGGKTLAIDRYAVTHDERRDFRPSDGQPFTRHYYSFSRR